MTPQVDTNRRGAAAAREALARSTMLPALRAQDEAQIHKHGPLAAVMQSPTEATAVRRAALVLAWTSPADVYTALSAWFLMRGTRTS